MAIEYTANQRAAIDSRGRPLLVSAAAGSGKTAVLVDRVVGLLEGENRASIEDLLVVTFTNAAAAEMRGRIADALAARLAQNPHNDWLRRQLALLGEARIATLHAFCQDLLRRNFPQAGVSPDFTLLDTPEAKRLRARAMEMLLEEEYRADTPDFNALRALICEERGDRELQGAVEMIYEKLRSHHAPEAWLDYIASREQVSPRDIFWCKDILARAGRTLDYVTAKMKATREELREDAVYNSQYGGAFDHCLIYAGQLDADLKGSWDAAHRRLSGYESVRLKPVRGSDNAEFGERMKAVRREFEDAVKKLRDGPLSLSEADIMAQEAAARPHIAELCRLVGRFTAVYGGLKAEAEALDFSDLEHRTLALLREPQAAHAGPHRDWEADKTELARALTGELREVLVDEYQDINGIQERILNSLIREDGPAFFVGDIKQSIYRFRLADPTIFRDRLSRSRPLEHSAEGPAHLSLSRNFRSLPAVIEVCNHVFSRVMSEGLGGIDYVGGQRLEAGRDGDGGPCELIILDTEGLSSQDEDSEERVTYEARIAAERIADFLQNAEVIEGDGARRPARAGDCAILLSSFSKRAPYFAEALGRAGIPAQSAGADDFFGAIEISILISLLRVIDNRRQDIPLIAVLRSPLFAFDADDLARVRLCAPGQDFCTALERAAATGDVKSADFLARLDAFESASRDMTVAQLLRYVMNETGAAGVFAALKDGARRTARLETLLATAHAFERGGARGLYRFLVHLDDRMTEGEPPVTPFAGAGVQLMSIHKAKGLEFPLVVVPDLGKRFNSEDTRGRVLFHEGMGLGLTLREPARRIEYKSASKQAIAAAIRAEGLDEEMRKLYVALTRAKQRLVLIMSVRDAPKELENWAREAHGPLMPEYLASRQSAAPWLGAALITHPGAAALRALCTQPPPVGEGRADSLTCRVIHYSDVGEARYIPASAPSEAEAEPSFDRELALLDLRYAHETAGALPSKLTPTGLRRLVPDAGEIDGTAGRADVRMYRRYEGPSALTALGRGTALHSYLLHMDYSACGNESAAKADILRATMAGHLTAEEAAAVPPGSVTVLARSPLGERVRAAETVLREYEFSALFTAQELLQNGLYDEEILLNGAIDLLLFGPEGMEVVDFKSDAIAPGFEARQAEKHRLQLELYGAAARKVFGLPVWRTTIYFLATGGEASL